MAWCGQRLRSSSARTSLRDRHASPSRTPPTRHAKQPPPAGTGGAIGTAAGSGGGTGGPQRGLHRRQSVPALRLCAAGNPAARRHDKERCIAAADGSEQHRHPAHSADRLRISPVAGEHGTDHRQSGECRRFHHGGTATAERDPPQRRPTGRCCGREYRDAICRGHAARACERREPVASAGAAGFTRGRDQCRYHRLQPVQ